MTHVPATEKRTWDLNQTDIKASARSSPCSDRDPGLIHKPASLGDKAKAYLSHMSSYFI